MLAKGLVEHVPSSLLKKPHQDVPTAIWLVGQAPLATPTYITESHDVPEQVRNVSCPLLGTM